MRKKVHKVLEIPFETYKESFSDKQIKTLKEHAERLNKIFGSPKQLSKIVNKILDF